MKDLEEVKQRLHEINKKGGTVEEELGEHITFLMIELAHAKKGQSLMFSQLLHQILEVGLALTIDLGESQTRQSKDRVTSENRMAVKTAKRILREIKNRSQKSKLEDALPKSTPQDEVLDYIK